MARNASNASNPDPFLAKVRETFEEALRSSATRSSAARSVTAPRESIEVIAERAKRKMLEQAERALDAASTSQERTAAVAAMASALRANGLDGAPKAAPGTVNVTVELASDADDADADDDVIDATEHRSPPQTQ